MIRGTTPTHTFELPFDVSFISKVRILYSQDDTIVLKRENDGCTLSGNTVTTKLTQEETLAFNVFSPVDIQIRVLTTGNDALASDPMRVMAGVLLEDGVIE